jgi:ATP-dependent Lhr-like helicase
MLRGVRTVIVDEIHAVAANKRGSHLALTIECLARARATRQRRIHCPRLIMTDPMTM